MRKYKVSRNLILQQNKKRKPASMAIEHSYTWIDRLFNALFELHLCAIEPVRPVHKNHGGW